MLCNMQPASSLSFSVESHSGCERRRLHTQAMGVIGADKSGSAMIVRSRALAHSSAAHHLETALGQDGMCLLTSADLSMQVGAHPVPHAPAFQPAAGRLHPVAGGPCARLRTGAPVSHEVTGSQGRPTGFCRVQRAYQSPSACLSRSHDADPYPPSAVTQTEVVAPPIALLLLLSLTRHAGRCS